MPNILDSGAAENADAAHRWTSYVGRIIPKNAGSRQAELAVQVINSLQKPCFYPGSSRNVLAQSRSYRRQTVGQAT